MTVKRETTESLVLSTPWVLAHHEQETPQHLPVWGAETHTLRRLGCGIQNPGLCRRTIGLWEDDPISWASGDSAVQEEAERTTNHVEPQNCLTALQKRQ